MVEQVLETEIPSSELEQSVDSEAQPAAPQAKIEDVDIKEVDIEAVDAPGDIFADDLPLPPPPVKKGVKIKRITDTDSDLNPDPDPNDNPDPSPGQGEISPPNLEITVLGIAPRDPENETDIRGGASIAAAAEDQGQTKNYENLSTPQQLTGTAGNDTIYAVDPAMTGIGMHAHTLEIEVGLENSDLKPTTVIISGLGDTIAVLNGVRIGNDWVVPTDPEQPTIARVELAYKLPSMNDTPNEAGLFAHSSLALGFEMVSDKDDSVVSTKKTGILLGIREIESADDLTYAFCPNYKLNLG